MVSLSVNIDSAAVSRLDALLKRVSKETPRRLATEVRRAALYICAALKKRTKIAPKRIPANEYRAAPSNTPPKYIHGKDGRLLRRWSLTRLVGTSDEHTFDHGVTTSARRGKNGRMVGRSIAKERRELIAYHGQIAHRGLARKSWGWVAQGIYGGAGGLGDLSWKRRKRDRRDPRDYVRGVFANYGAAASATLENRLDYALDALPAGALESGIDAAVKRLEYNISNHLERATA